MPAFASKDRYSRAEVARMVGLTLRQLRAWEATGLLPAGGEYDLPAVGSLRKLLDLRRQGHSRARIVRALNAVRRYLHGVADPLRETKVVAEGPHLRVVLNGQRMEATSGQLLFDFEPAEWRRLLEFPGEPRLEKRPDKRLEAGLWFQRGLELEQAGAPAAEAIEAYEKAIALDQECLGALVNLGTIHFHARRWKESEAFYRRALAVDPDYALAHFNLGNLLDEQGDDSRAAFHYQAALRVNPDYADAHYNLALLSQRGGDLMRALGHWQAYLKLDPVSEWAQVARRELDKIRAATIVGGAGKGQTPASAGGTP